MSNSAQLVTSSHSMAGAYASQPQKSDDYNVVSFQTVWTGGSAAGAFSVQSSNDNANGYNTFPTNWSTVPIVSGSNELQSITVAGASASPLTLRFRHPASQWMRFLFAPTGGSVGQLTSVTFLGTK